MSHATPENDLNQFEHALASLSPAPARMDRDRLFYRAGIRQGSRGRFAIPAATGLTTLALGLGLGILASPVPGMGGRESPGIIASTGPEIAPAQEETAAGIDALVVEAQAHADEQALLARLRTAC